MKIALAHFTDIHFSVKTNIDNRIASCLEVIKNDFYGAAAMYFVISGDISFSGNAEEFALAKTFFNKIKNLLERQYSPMKVKFVMVPGNHDCNFTNESQIRVNSVNSLDYNFIGKDNSVIDACLAVQDDFWDFYALYNPVPSDKLFYQIKDVIGDYNICFHCLNTSWVSQKKEKAGNLFFPVRRYDNYVNQDGYLNIGVWHHPYNWLSPSGAENNKREFELLTERIASVHLLGHEHEDEFYLNENKKTGDKVNLLSGKVFNDSDNSTISGFQTISIDLKMQLGKLNVYDWNKTIYTLLNEKDVAFSKYSFRRFNLTDAFYNELDEIKIPLVIGERKNIRLNEVFVFPDLDAMKSDIKVLDNYKDSSNLLNNSFGNCVIGGEEQSGKSSLLNVIYSKKFSDGKYPILITGKEIKELDLIKILRRAFKRQYSNADTSFDAYLQLDKSKKTLLIDDFQDCKFSAASVYNLLKEAMAKFEVLMITIDSANSLLPIIQTEFKDIDFYKIKPLGYVKRNELIERYHAIKGTHNIENINDTVKESFDKVRSVLGDKLMPSTPIYILSILQSLDYNALRQNETSFGFCYQTLIHFSLHKANIKSEDIDTYFNILTELAYEYTKRDVEILAESDLLDFFAKYSSTYHAPPFDRVMTNLKSSKILISTEGGVKFGYPYILYYLSAKKIADVIHTPEGKKMVKKLFAGMHIEKNGTILVFITHHSKDVSFIEESLLNSMVVLSDYAPITLALDDPFYNQIKKISEDVSKEILEANTTPREVRKGELKLLDEAETEPKTETTEPTKDLMNELEDSNDTLIEDMNKVTLPFKQAFRSIEVIGQIIRNRKGSLEITQLKDMIKEGYTTGFRTITYSSQLLLAAKDQIIKMLNDDDLAESSKREIEKSVGEFVMMNSYEACIGVFSKLMGSLGIRDLRHLFIEAGQEINTPAAKLLSFGINSYYGNISESELKAIIVELKGNAVAMKMLRSRVKSYVYSKDLDIKLKQKYASLLEMTVGPTRPKHHTQS